MPHVLIIAQESQTQESLCNSLVRYGFACSLTPYDNGVRESINRQSPDMLLVEMDSNSIGSETWELVRGMKQAKPLPVIALIPGEMLESIDGRLDADDFITSPYDAGELALRIKRLLHIARNTGSAELIKCDGLVIDLARCEVAVQGRVVELTFKEYELLKLLAGNPGRVYSRNVLLDRVWGYDYYGGDRTVDVHIRRLRSKIEDTQLNFIETVRNIGYRFKKDV